MKNWLATIIGKAVEKILPKKPEPVKPNVMPEAFKLGPAAPQKVIDNTKWKGVTIEGSTFPDDPYRYDLLKPNFYVLNEYLPAFDKAFPNAPKGLKYLCQIMTMVEGFKPGTRSYNHHNPGNIGNTDSGANKKLVTLEDGVRLQVEFLQDIAAGKKKMFPLGKEMYLKPEFSKEISKSLKNYMVKSGDLPGYRFIYTGQLDQYVKIYATLPRIRNDYVNRILTFFVSKDIELSPSSKLADIITIV